LFKLRKAPHRRGSIELYQLVTITQLGLLASKSEIRPKIYILELCTAFIFGFYFKAGFFDTSKTFSTKTRLVSFSLKKSDKNIIRSASKKVRAEYFYL
jgi:hypothetical protein